MKAQARIVAEAGRDGGTRLVVLRGEAPLLPRRTGPGRVHLVGGAAGPLRGDDLLLEIEVGPGASLCVHTVAASIILGGQTDEPSRTTVHATVAPGARLAWLPEPVIATAGCHHITHSTVELAAGAGLTWREELVCGRQGEQPGDLRLLTRVRHDGRPLSTQELAVGPDAAGWSGPAVLGGYRAAGTVLLAGPGIDVAAPRAAFAGTGGGPGAGTAEGSVLRLAGGALLASAVAPDAHALRCALDRLVAVHETRCLGDALSSAEPTRCLGDALSSAEPTRCLGDALSSAEPTRCLGDALSSAEPTRYEAATANSSG